MMNYGLSNLLGRIERDTQCIKWALDGLKGNSQTKRIFIDRRMASLKSSYARLNDISEVQATELLAAVKLPSLFPPPSVQQEREQPKEDTLVKSREDMAQAREKAQLYYTTWLYAVTRLPVSQAQAKLATKCFDKLQEYNNQLIEIVGKDEATEIITEIFTSVQAAAAAEQDADVPAGLPELAEQLE